MKKMITIALGLCVLGGCSAPRVDEFGYQRHSFFYDTDYMEPAKHITFDDAAQLAAWCTSKLGHISYDGLGCASDDGGLVTEDCTEANVAGMPADRLVALTRWMDGICRGWRDKWTTTAISSTHW